MRIQPCTRVSIQDLVPIDSGTDSKFSTFHLLYGTHENPSLNLKNLYPGRSRGPNILKGLYDGVGYQGLRDERRILVIVIPIIIQVLTRFSKFELVPIRIMQVRIELIQSIQTIVYLLSFSSIFIYSESRPPETKDRTW